MRRVAFAFLWIALGCQIVWIIVAGLVQKAGVGMLAYPAAVAIAFAALALAGQRWHWVPATIRIFIGFAFASSVCDRLGFFGGPGTPGVSWGDFAHFVTYTRSVNSFLPASAATPLAMMATLLETGLGLALVFGLGIRTAAAGAALLLLLFGSAMTASFGIASQFSYAVSLMAAGAWALSTIDASTLSIDAALRRQSKSSPPLPSTRLS